MAKRTGIFYGESGDTKTHQLFSFARWYVKNYKKKCRLITSDGGGFGPFDDSGMIDRGECQAFDISYRKEALADIRRLSEGYWPRKGKRGPMSIFTSDLKCAPQENTWDEVGCYLVDGITSICRLWLNHISDQSGGVGFKEAWNYSEGGYEYNGLQQGHYGLVQKELYRIMVHGFKALPVDFVFYTALVEQGEDRKGKTVYGPKAAGSAITAEIPSWVQDCLHLEQIQFKKDGNVIKQKVAHFVKHRDKETGIDYEAKVRVMAEYIPRLMRLYPKGYIKLGLNEGEAIDKFYSDVFNLKNMKEDEE